MNQRTARRYGMSRAGIAGCVLMFALCTPSLTPAHLLPPNLSLYGPFTAGSVRCLRIIGTQTQRCFTRVLALQRDCTDHELAGQTCDTAQRDTQIAAAKQTAQDTVAATCLGGQLTELSFSSLEEAQADVARACGDQADAVMSMAYPPAVAAAPGAVHASTAECMAQTAAASHTLLRVSVRWRSRAFDRLATHFIVPSKKIALMARVDADIGAAVDALAAHVGDMCPLFNTVYGQNPLTFLTKLASRGDCIVSGAYVQSVVICPTPVCGNGIKETGEQCDDGNQVDNDACSNGCSLR